jgi:hypothetical protein
VVGDGWFDTLGSASLREDSAICLKTYNDRFGWSGELVWILTGRENPTPPRD